METPRLPELEDPVTYTPPDPNANPRDTGGDLVSLTPGGHGTRYPKDNHVWGEFAYLAVEAGGYSDLTAINPYTGDRLHVSGPDTPHEYCTNRCGTCGLATRRDDQGNPVHHDHAYNPGGHGHAVIELVESPDCPHKHGGRVGIMSNNPASTRYFHELRTRLDKQRAEDREDDSVNVYEQLRRLIDAMEASKFLDGPET